MHKLEVEDIHKHYCDNQVLKGVSLKAKQGDVISLIGASGSGKSTFLRCINLLEQPNAGTLTLDGERLKMAANSAGVLQAEDAKQLQRLRSRLAMVFQHFNLWSHLSVLDNITLAPRKVLGVSHAEAKERALAYLDKVGLSPRVATQYPASLSGGQQQRVAIARALAMEPEIILLDEPTSALDPELVGEVLKVIQTLANEGRTLLMVTHEMRFAREVSTQVVFLHQGKIEEQGSAEEVFVQPRSERLQGFLSNNYK